jgi:uncharacterized protein (DUF433 family)
MIAVTDGGRVMSTVAKAPRIRAQVVSDASVMGGAPVVRGTRVPAATVVAYLRAGRTAQEIFEDYPSLPIDGIDAVVEWAEASFGPDWRNGAPRS